MKMKMKFRFLYACLLGLLLTVPLAARDTLIAHAEGRYVIYFDPNGGTVLTESREVGPDNKLSNLPNPIRDGYQFEGWYREDGSRIYHTTVFTEDTYVQARWKGSEPERRSTVFFEAEGGTVSVSSMTTGANGRLSNLPNPTRSGFRFDGWYTEEGNKIGYTTVFDSDITVYARWTALSGNSSGGNSQTAQDSGTSSAEETAPSPAQPDNTNTPSAGGWKQDASGWWYDQGNGLYPQNEWLSSSGNWYFFNQRGYMQNGWQQIGGYWYYFDTSGKMTTGWASIDGNFYYFETGSGQKPIGALYQNEQTPDGYLVDANGVWLSIN